jgi:hypothetical protein
MLLLPLEAYSASKPITPEVLMDHVVHWDSANREAPMVTFSGLRGTTAEYAFLSFSVILCGF